MICERITEFLFHYIIPAERPTAGHRHLGQLLLVGSYILIHFVLVESSTKKASLGRKEKEKKIK